MRKTVWSPRSTILADALSQARKEAGLHQSQVAALMGNDQTVVSHIERGHRRIDIIEFYDFAQAIGRDPVELYRTIVERWGMAED